jgi:hypothetical protein
VILFVLPLLKKNFPVPFLISWAILNASLTASTTSRALLRHSNTWQELAFVAFCIGIHDEGKYKNRINGN